MKKENKVKTKTITFADLTGQKFGHLTVLKLDHIQNRTRYWLCECDCELKNKKVVKERYLIEGATQSCGCIKNKNNVSFMSTDAIITDNNRKLYYVWNNTMHRCYNKNNKKYKEYGALGIIVCKEWKDFNVFNNWSVTNGYKEGVALIRKDKHGNYEPSNCVWDLKINYHKIQSEYENNKNIQNKTTEIILGEKIVDIQNYINVNNHDVKIIEFKGERVISSNEIAKVHQLENRNVKENFNNNKKHLIEGVDYFILSKVDYELIVNEKLPKYYNATKEIILFTERGYSMMVKTFDGDLAWKIHRQLVDSYFTVRQIKENPETKDIPQIQNIQSIDILETIVTTFKEQQTIINNQNNKINDLENKYISLEDKLKNMVKAIS